MQPLQPLSGGSSSYSSESDSLGIVAAMKTRFVDKLYDEVVDRRFAMVDRMETACETRVGKPPHHFAAAYDFVQAAVLDEVNSHYERFESCVCENALKLKTVEDELGFVQGSSRPISRPPVGLPPSPVPPDPEAENLVEEMKRLHEDSCRLRRAIQQCRSKIGFFKNLCTQVDEMHEGLGVLGDVSSIEKRQRRTRELHSVANTAQRDIQDFLRTEGRRPGFPSFLDMQSPPGPRTPRRRGEFFRSPAVNRFAPQGGNPAATPSLGSSRWSLSGSYFPGMGTDESPTRMRLSLAPGGTGFGNGLGGGGGRPVSSEERMDVSDDAL